MNGTNRQKHTHTKKNGIFKLEIEKNNIKLQF